MPSNLEDLQYMQRHIERLVNDHAKSKKYPEKIDISRIYAIIISNQETRMRYVCITVHLGIYAPIATPQKLHIAMLKRAIFSISLNIRKNLSLNKCRATVTDMIINGLPKYDDILRKLHNTG